MRQERLDLQVILEAQAQREQQGQLDLKELLAQLDQLVVPEPLDRLDHRVQRDQRVQMGLLALRVQQVQLVQMQRRCLVS